MRNEVSAKSPMEILEVRPDQMIIKMNGKVKIVKYTPYVLLKNKYFNGGMIEQIFREGLRVAETTEEGVFNCFFGSDRIQTRNREGVANAILHFIKTGEIDEFVNVINIEKADVWNHEFIENAFRSFGDRVKIDKSSWTVTIDDIFVVDQYANAYIKADNPQNKKKYNRHLCVVVRGRQIEGAKQVVHTEKGDIEVNERTLTMLGKIYFLLNPRMRDEQFTSQLSTETLEMLKQRLKKTQPEDSN